MAKILLFDPDESHANAIVSMIEVKNHKVTVYASRQSVFNHLSTELAQFTVIMFEFSNRPEDWDFLDKLRRLILACVPKPGILCVARTNLGPSVKLRLERMGVRLVYERPA